MSTFDVPFRSEVPPQFPDLCVGCEREHPQHTARISVIGARSTFGWAIDTTLLVAGQPVQGTNVTVELQVPCCPQCAPALARHHTLKKIFLYVSGLGAAAVMVALIALGSSRGWPQGLTVTLALLACLACLALPVIWEMRRPPAFTLTPRSDDVVFEFRSEKCAAIFRALNRAATPKTGVESIPRPTAPAR